MENRANGKGIMGTESIESNWVPQEDDDEENPNGEGLDFKFKQVEEGDAEEEDEFYGDDEEPPKLVRTGPTFDPLDMEALEIYEARKDELGDQEFDFRKSIMLTFQTLAVVFGDVGTSPLYTFDVMFNNSPVRVKEDVLGALSLVLYTLILIPLVKYVLVVLWANDDGEGTLEVVLCDFDGFKITSYSFCALGLMVYAFSLYYIVTISGGTFALYSLICRNAKVSFLTNQVQADTRRSSFRLKVPSPELERSIKIREHFEASLTLKNLLLALVLFGTSMVIANGVVTPAMSVLAAVSGLKIGISSFKQDKVVMISVAFLVILFTVQRFITSKVGLAIGPALFIWFCSLGGVGIYNLVKYDTTVFAAFNPIYIYLFFERNKKQAWMSLGGCLLCATGSEAMFADLCYFPVKSTQLTFLFLVLPCLILGYLGQAAFLMENQNASEQVFFSSIPSGAFWPLFFIANIAALIASRAMTTATFSCIKQSMALGCFPRLRIIHPSRKFMGHIYIPAINWFLLASCLAFVATFGNINEIGNAYGISEIGVMITTTILTTIIMLLVWQINIIFAICFVVFFLSLELLFFSSVLVGVGVGSWVMLVFAGILFLIMSIWNYGSKLKYESEVSQKLPMDLLKNLGCNLGTIRTPGIGLVYNELVKGVPAIFGHFLATLPAIHSMIIFVSIMYVPVPTVPQSERFLFSRVCPRSYHMFRCLARYGYKDVRKESHHEFEQLLVRGLDKFIKREAQERSLQSDDDFDSDADDGASRSSIIVARNGSMYSLSVPLLVDFDNCVERPTSEASTSSQHDGDGGRSDVEKNLEMELSLLRKAEESGVVYLLAHGDIRARKSSWFLKKLVINYFYAFLRKNFQREMTQVSVPRKNLMRIRRTYMV